MADSCFLVGDAYEPYVGRWSRLVARQFVTWLAAPAGSHWLDVGCGTGALTEVILDTAAPASVQGIDPSLGFIRYARAQVRDPRASFTVADARALPQSDRTVDVAASGLALNFIPHPGVGLAEIARVVRGGGVVAAYVWDYAGEMQLMRVFWDAAVGLDTRAVELDEGRRFPLCHPDALESLFRGAHLRDVECRPIDVPTPFRDFEDYWRPFLGGQGPAPGYAMSLDEERRVALRERIRSALPVSANGTIDLVARAWAVRGTVQ